MPTVRQDTVPRLIAWESLHYASESTIYKAWRRHGAMPLMESVRSYFFFGSAAGAAAPLDLSCFGFLTFFLPLSPNSLPPSVRLSL